MKKVLTGLFISTAVLGFGLQAKAEMKEDADTKQITSDANITVKGGDANESTNPIIDNFPDGETFQKGNLTIDNLIQFNFEDMSISGETQNINLKTIADNTSQAKRNVQVTDKTGTGVGWNLQIKQSALTNGTTELKGAYIKMAAGIVQTTADNVDPTLKPTTLNYDQGSANKGSFAKIMTATKGNGMGTWISFYNQEVPDNVISQGHSYTQKADPTDIQLVVPSGNLAGSYTGTVTWALTSTPDANPAE